MVSFSFRLLAVGLLAGVLSSFYPSLSTLLPYSIASYLPFLNAAPPLTKTAWSTYFNLQHSMPIAANHDPADEIGPLEERLRRLGTEEGRKKEFLREAKERKEKEGRKGLSGFENTVEEGGGVTWLVGDLKMNPLLPTIIKDLVTISPSHLIFLGPSDSHQITLYVSSSTPFTNSLQSALAHAGHPSILSQPLPELRPPFILPPEINLIFLGIPKNGDQKTWEEIGEGLQKARKGGSEVLCCFGEKKEERGVVPGRLKKEDQFTIHTTLAHHTSHPRLLALSSLPQKWFPPWVFAAISAAGDSEGIELGRLTDPGLSEYEKDGTGWGWRFGGPVF